MPASNVVAYCYGLPIRRVRAGDRWCYEVQLRGSDSTYFYSYNAARQFILNNTRIGD